MIPPDRGGEKGKKGMRSSKEEDSFKRERNEGS